MSDLTPCEAAIVISRMLFDWLHNRPSVKEESITDWFLYQMETRCKLMKFTEYSRHQESTLSGADFDWIIQFPGHHWKLRVQAKRLRNLPNISRSLRHPKNTGAQMRQLLRYSLSTGHYPTYAYYTELRNNCRAEPMPFDCVYFASGLETYRYFHHKNQTVTPSAVMGVSIPMISFLCRAVPRVAMAPSPPGLWLSSEELPQRFAVGRKWEQLPDNLGFEEGLHPLIEAKPSYEVSGVSADREPGPYFDQNPQTSRVLLLDVRNLPDRP